MSVPIEREPNPDPWTLERCCFCRVPTPMWTALDSRSAGEQVACCEGCASRASEVAVPSKAEWFEREAIATGPVHADRAKYFTERERYGRRAKR